MRLFRHALLSLLAITLFAVPAQADFTPNKEYERQTTGTNRNLWGIVVNNILTTIDLNIAGLVIVDVSGSSNVPATNTDKDYLYQKLTGTITANIEYILPDLGSFYFIENATTGAFTVKITNVSAGTGVVIPQGTTSIVYSDAAGNRVVSPVGGVLLAANNLSDVDSALAAFDNIKQSASVTYSGAVELATDAETVAGTDTDRAVTPAGLAAAFAAQSGFVLPGTITMYAGSTEPAGYIFSYGQTISRVTYSGLFDVIGTTYGAGDGSTTFNVPDCRGRVGAGRDDMGGVAANRLTGTSGGVNGASLGAGGGAQQHTLTIGELAAHSHNLTNTFAAITAGSGGGSAVGYLGGQPGIPTATQGADGPHNNVQPTIIFNCLIKL